MLREEPIRSEKYRRGAKGAPCRFRGPTCNCDPQTSQFSHLNGAAFGKGAMLKAHDIAGLDACSACHAYIDVGHATKPLITDAEFWRLLLRGVIETMVDRVRRQIIIVPLDPERLVNDRPTPPRKPPAERTKIPTRQTDWPSRSMQSRNSFEGKR